MNPRAPGLLVSVRSAHEARDAYLGGASVIDVKEPSRGPLGAADPAIWQQVRHAISQETRVSVALGELRDWKNVPPPPGDTFAGIAFRKIGLAGSGPHWKQDWANLRSNWGGKTPWIAVIYADWQIAHSPPPDAIIETAVEASCAGVLIDTWDKSRGPIVFNRTWIERIRRIRKSGGLVAIAGRLDCAAIARIGALNPDLFAVRSAACSVGDRLRSIDRNRVAQLVACISQIHDNNIS